MSDIVNTLNRLHELRAASKRTAEEMQALIDATIPADVRQAIADIHAEYDQTIADINAAAAVLEAQAKDAILQHGATVKADNLMAVYVGGRVSWDDKALNGYMVDHPELARFRNIGKPSVTIRGAS